VTQDEYESFLGSLSPRETRVLTDRFGSLSELSPEFIAHALAEALPATIARIREIERSFRTSDPDGNGPSGA
jgi:DNA-directed RNA polymerase sigma subunit (sigma70/sigma32)